MKGKKIVVVDDCRLHLAMFRDLLAEQGAEVVATDNGIEANRHIHGVSMPDLVILDVEMPLLRGDRKVQLIRERQGVKELR